MREVAYMVVLGLAAWLAVHYGMPRRRPVVPPAPASLAIECATAPELPALPAAPELPSVEWVDTEALIRASLLTSPVPPVVDGELLDVRTGRYPLVALPPVLEVTRVATIADRPAAGTDLALIVDELDDPAVGVDGQTVWFHPAGDGLHDPALDTATATS